MVVGTLDEISAMISIDGYSFRGPDAATTSIAEVAHLYRAICDGTRPSDLVRLVKVDPPP